MPAPRGAGAKLGAGGAEREGNGSRGLTDLTAYLLWFCTLDWWNRHSRKLKRELKRHRKGNTGVSAS